LVKRGAVKVNRASWRAADEPIALVADTACRRPTGPSRTTEHFYVAVTTSGGYDGPTLSARAIERALSVRALEEDVPIDGIRVQRWEAP
jgi:hypothetical protein